MAVPVFFFVGHPVTPTRPFRAYAARWISRGRPLLPSVTYHALMSQPKTGRRMLSRETRLLILTITVSAVVLLLLAQPDSGRVTAGGVDLGRCDPAAWRSRVAWVPQRPTLFRGTVADNIRLGAPDATDEEVRAAAATAGADELVRALPEGYGTVVGDGGRPLSTGEVRRVALARAFLRDAPLVLLDEPTADLDPRSAELVARAVERLLADRTVLLVTHRPDLVARADRVVRLAGGRIVEISTSAAA